MYKYVFLREQKKHLLTLVNLNVHFYYKYNIHKRVCVCVDFFINILYYNLIYVHMMYPDFTSVEFLSHLGNVSWILFEL